MRIMVTEATISEYGLDELTGNSREDLLRRVTEMKAAGYDMFINIPDVEGGDTEAPSERNVFEHFNEELPEPDGLAHVQDAVNLFDTHCHYVSITTFVNPDKPKWFCRIHGMESKYDIALHPNAPCISVDPQGNSLME